MASHIPQGKYVSSSACSSKKSAQQYSTSSTKFVFDIKPGCNYHSTNALNTLPWINHLEPLPWSRDSSACWQPGSLEKAEVKFPFFY